MTVSLKGDEVRTFPALEFRDVEPDQTGRWLEGRAVPYGVEQDVGWYLETVRKGAFTKSIREAARRLPLLLWHDSHTFPIGVSHQWNERDDGLWCTWELDTADERAVEAARKARAGMLTGLSVGFVPIKSERTVDEETGIVHVTRIEARLLEVSLTPTPAFAGAQVSLVRSREHLTREKSPRRSARLDAWRTYLRSLTDTSTS